jgi:hypothetical protein|uniref:Uncharacterized protein n=1 Tax=viral metagenome TaxID=1070528 RepID=A0A6C0BDP0_9ZZZZ
MLFVLFLFIVIIYVFNYCYYLKEDMTLKTECLERDAECYTACSSRKHVLNKQCYEDCKIHSPIC